MRLDRRLLCCVLWITISHYILCVVGNKLVLDDVIGQSRSRRATSEGRVIVVSSSATGQLLTLESVPRDPEEVFQFLNPAPPGLTISNDGKVSRQSGYLWNSSAGMDVIIEFSVNVTKPATAPVTFPVKLIVRDSTEPLFSNRPAPMWSTSPVWIRPDTPVYRLQARAVQDGANVTYRLESGGEGQFQIDPVSGDVSVSERMMFEAGRVYTLGVSAQCQGLLPSTSTPTQPLYIQIGQRAPQLDPSTLNISFTEATKVDEVVGTLMAKSFQNLPLTYKMSAVRPTGTDQLFSLNPTTGVIILKSPMVYLRDPRQYMLEVSVDEQYTNSRSTATLLLYLRPANHAPRFLVQVYVNNGLPEQSPVGTSVVEVMAFDQDPGKLGELTYTVSSKAFQVVPGPNGGAVLQVAGVLNYEFLNDLRRYELTLTATDGGTPPLSSTASVQVYIINANNRAPVFEPEEQVVLIKEGATQGLTVHYIQAYDPDGDGISFQVDNAQTSAQTREYFSVSSAGVVTLLKPVPRFPGIVPNFTLIVTATDDGSCCSSPGTIHTTTGSVVIKVQRINTQPVFASCASYRPNVNEGSAVGTSVLQMVATENDIDDDGLLNFTIVNVDGTSPFEVVKMDDGRTALLRTRVVFDRDYPTPGMTYYRFNDTIKYPVTVKVQDSGKTPLATNCFMLVTINDVNDNPPEFDYPSSSYIGTTLTSGSVGERITRVYAVDPDSGDNGKVSYEMSSSSSPACRESFNVEPQTGWINRAKPTLTEGLIQCVIAAKDGGNPSKSDTTTVSISVVSSDQDLLSDWLPVNGSLGEIDDYVYMISEDVPVYTMVALSLKATTKRGSNPNDVGYYLTSSQALQLNSNNDFEISSQSPSAGAGAALRVVKQLDASNVDSYVLRMRAFSPASDTTGKASVARLRVSVADVNNKRPQFLGMDSNGIYPAAVSEYTQSGDPVIYVTAIDLDRDYINNKVTYSFAANCSDCLSFSIDANSGLISTRAGNFSRDSKASYVLTVEARDGADSSLPGVRGPNVATRTVSVQVNGVSSMPPYFTRPVFSYTIESGPPQNSTLFTQTATDPDTDNSYKHVVQYGIEAGNDGRKFAVDFVTGRVYNVREIIYSPQQSTYTLTYRVFDGAAINRTRLVVTVNPGQSSGPVPLFSPTMYNSVTQGLVEKSQDSVGATIARVNATSAGADSIVYSVLDTEHFKVDSNSGTVTLIKPLDRDYPGGYPTWQTNVIATGAGGGRGYAVVSVTPQDINDNSPIFNPCCLVGAISELASPGTAGLQLMATDNDAGANARVSYSLTPGQQTGPWTVSSSGLVTLTSGAALNYEQTKSYDLSVRATDGGSPPKSADQIITILVLDGNNNPPQFNTTRQYSAVMDEELPIGASVITLRAYDKDSADVLTYSFSGATQPEFFYIDSIAATNTGVIKVGKRIDYESLGTQTTFTLTVRVVDPDPSHSDSASVTISVRDINDNAPVFSPASVAVNVSEAAQVNSAVTTLRATDADRGDTPNIRYSIDYRYTDPQQRFKVDAVSGAISVRNMLDREAQAEYSVRVLASDMGSPPLTGTATLLVTLTGVNDSPPRLLAPPNQSMQVVRTGARPGDQVTCFDAVDPDLAASNQTSSVEFDYSLCTAPGCSDFTLQKQGTSRACLIAARPNGYSRSALGFNSYNISVGLKDTTTSQTAVVSLPPLIVESTNDRAPRDASKTIWVYNYNNPSTGLYANVPLGNVYVDDDDWDLPDKSFTIQDNSNNNAFSMSPTSRGQLLMKGSVGPGTYTLKVKVVDSKFSSQPAMGTVVVNVAILNDTIVQSAGSIRLSGLKSASDMLSPVSGGATRLDVLRQRIAGLLNTKPENVDVFSVRDVPDTDPSLVDVMYAAHGSPYYSAEKLNYLVWNARDDVGQALGATVTQAPIDLCREEFRNCYVDGCATRVVIGAQPRLLNINQTSLAGIDSSYQQYCGCLSQTSSPTPNPTCDDMSCLNGGVCQQNSSSVVACICPVGYDGLRCERTKISVSGGEFSYAQFRPLEGCERDRISVDFITTTPTGLILYNGPTNNNNNEPQDFISIELIDGKPKLRVNLGDGEVTLPGSDMLSRWARLDDNKWHTLEVFHVRKTIRLVVDYCNAAPVTETITNSTQDRTGCEGVVEAPGEKILISVTTPLQLGGRAGSATLNTPAGLTKSSFTGCIGNVRQNGKLYDLSLGTTRQHSNVAEGCQTEDCTACPTDSSCVGGLKINNVAPTAPTCSCSPGLIGDKCNTATSVRMLGKSPTLMRWTFTNAQSFNTSLLQMNNILHIMFRTLQTDGFLFFSESFSTLERIILELVGGRLRFRYDLGDGDRSLSLNEVKVNDGEWHLARVNRHNRQVYLSLDEGSGSNYAELYEPFDVLPNGPHRLMRVSPQIMAGGLGRLNPYTSQWDVTNNLQYTCVADVRYGNTWLPLTDSESASHPVASLTAVNVGDLCENLGVCSARICGPAQWCDQWRPQQPCRCNDPLMMISGGVCVPLTTCSPTPCVRGACVIMDGMAQCVCPIGWSGPVCDGGGPTTDSSKGGSKDDNLALKIALPVVLGIVLLALLAMLLAVCLRRRRDDKILLVEPDQDIRETMGSYDEEGAGEEDIYAFDLSRLQKPIDPDLESVEGKPRDETLLRYGQLTGSAPEDLPDRPRRAPGDYTDIGDFIADRLRDADNDPTNNDATREFDYEGTGSETASLSSIGSGSVTEEDFDYLRDWGPEFEGLANMYGDHDEQDEGFDRDEGVSNV